jgi:hypothetical protein
LLSGQLKAACIVLLKTSRPTRSSTLARTEASYQSTLIKRYEQEGWYVLKLIQTNKPGIPDLVLMKPGQIRFVEVKSASGRLSKIQEYRHDQLRLAGFDVEVDWDQA